MQSSVLSILEENPSKQKNPSNNSDRYLFLLFQVFLFSTALSSRLSKKMNENNLVHFRKLKVFSVNVPTFFSDLMTLHKHKM